MSTEKVEEEAAQKVLEEISVCALDFAKPLRGDMGSGSRGRPGANRQILAKRSVKQPGDGATEATHEGRAL